MVPGGEGVKHKLSIPQMAYRAWYRLGCYSDLFTNAATPREDGYIRGYIAGYRAALRAARKPKGGK